MDKEHNTKYHALIPVEIYTVPENPQRPDAFLDDKENWPSWVHRAWLNNDGDIGSIVKNHTSGSYFVVTPKGPQRFSPGHILVKYLASGIIGVFSVDVFEKNFIPATHEVFGYTEGCLELPLVQILHGITGFMANLERKYYGPDLSDLVFKIKLRTHLNRTEVKVLILNKNDTKLGVAILQGKTE